MRALSASTLLASLALSLGALELGVRTLYQAPAPMLDKALAYQSLAHTQPELLIFGTCLPEQIIQTQALSEQLGLQVSNLATPAGTARLFYLVLKHYVPQHAQVQAIVLPFGKRDLSKEMAPHESQVMALASWQDMPDLARWACKGDSSCVSELLLRRSSQAYRNRGYLANKLWQSVGLREPIAGYVLSPGAIEPPKGQAPPPMLKAPPAPSKGPAKGVDSVDPEFLYLHHFLALAAERGIPVVLVPLPERASFEGRAGDPTQVDYQQRLSGTILSHGAQLLEMDQIPGLSASDFVDDVHLSQAGRARVTDSIGAALLGQ